jgi:uncharacterized RDD family membrane protein YckC
VVGLAQTAFDIASFAASVALPGILWAVLFLLAWSHGPFAESVGLGRKVFWLLAPGALLTSFAFLPFAPVSYDWLAVGVSGALFPMLVGGLAVGRYAPPIGRSLAAFLALSAALSAALFVIVLPSTGSDLARLGASLHTSSGGVEILLVTIVGVAFAAGVAAFALRSPRAPTAAIALLFGLVVMALVLTFAGSAAIPGVGISEPFPYYLLPPVLVGFAAGVAAPRVFPKEEGFALPVAFFAATFGVLLGADLLREPPLYGHGPAGLYTIGGAGIFDLVYLSGLLALAAAYLVHAALARKWTPIGPPLPQPPLSPLGHLEHAFSHGVEGHLGESLRESASASHEAAAQARRLLDAGDPPDGKPWGGLPVPGWTVSDQANLDAVVASGTSDPREAYRAWLTARQLVVVGRELGLGRFASVGQRVLAFALDLAIVTGVGCLVFAGIALRTPGGFGAVLSSLAFNAAIYGFVAAAFFYFAVAEAWTGTTPGKAAVRIAVRDRSLRPPDWLATLVRNAPLAPILVFVGLGAAIAVAIGVKGIPGAAATFHGFGLSVGAVAILAIVGVVVGAILLLGALGVLTIVVTWDRQRIGDLWAGTLVVRRATAPHPIPSGAAAPEPAGAGPSG